MLLCIEEFIWNFDVIRDHRNGLGLSHFSLTSLMKTLHRSFHIIKRFRSVITIVNVFRTYLYLLRSTQWRKQYKSDHNDKIREHEAYYKLGTTGQIPRILLIHVPRLLCTIIQIIL